jgi:hypothetical protein
MVEMTCMTTKKKFEVDGPEVVVLRNGKYCYKALCPWKGKNGRLLHAYKFASKAAWEEYRKGVESESECSEEAEDESSEHFPNAERSGEGSTQTVS